MLIWLSCAEPTPIDPIESIEAALEADTEAERYARLVEARSQAEGPLADDLDALLPFVEAWACASDHWEAGDQEGGEAGFLSAPISLEVWPEDFGSVEPAEPEDPTLRRVWALYRGRALAWNRVEHGLFTDLFDEEARELLAVADTPLSRAYLGEPIDWPLAPTHPDAPDYANHQHQLLSRLADLVDFWARRQAPDGQYGGGWGDDVEMWRWQAPLLLGFGYGAESTRVLADGVWALEDLEGGYSGTLTDVEHSAELTADTLTPMLLLDGSGFDEAAALTDLADALWLGTNDLGQRQFRSVYFTDDRVDDTTKHRCDTAYHARALQPALLAWTDEEVLTDWLATWASATLTEANGKPEGIPPSALAWPEGTPGPSGSAWYEAGCALNEDAYAYPRAQALLTPWFVAAWHHTGDEAWLEPLDAMAEQRRAWRADSTGDDVEGSAMWAASKLKGLVPAAAKARALGVEDYDDLLLAEGDPYVRMRLSGEREALVEALAEDAAALSVNEALWTEEVRFTDRALVFQREFSGGLKPDTDLVYSMVTGDLGGPSAFPLPAVRWDLDPRDVAILVTSTEPLQAELFNFSDEELDVAVICDGEAHSTLPPGVLCTLN